MNCNGSELKQVVQMPRASCQSSWPSGFGQLNPSPHSWIFTSVSVDSSLHSLLLGWLSNRTGTIVDDGKARRNMTSSAQFAALPLAKPVARFAHAVVNWHSRSVAKSVYSLPLQSKYLITLHQNEAQNPSNMWRSSSKISIVELCSITEIMPKSSFLCVNKNP